MKELFVMVFMLAVICIAQQERKPERGEGETVPLEAVVPCVFCIDCDDRNTRLPDGEGDAKKRSGESGIKFFALA